VYKRAPVYWTSVRRARDPRCGAARSNVRLLLVVDDQHRSRSSSAEIAEGRKTSRQRSTRRYCRSTFTSRAITIQPEFLSKLESLAALEVKESPMTSRRLLPVLPFLVSIPKLGSMCGRNPERERTSVANPKNKDFHALSATSCSSRRINSDRWGHSKFQNARSRLWIYMAHDGSSRRD